MASLVDYPEMKQNGIYKGCKITTTNIRITIIIIIIGIVLLLLLLLLLAMNAISGVIHKYSDLFCKSMEV